MSRSIAFPRATHKALKSCRIINFSPGIRLRRRFLGQVNVRLERVQTEDRRATQPWWLLFVELAGRIKRSEEMVSRIQRIEDQELLVDFAESASGCLTKLCESLTTYEKPMIPTAMMVATKTKVIQRGSKSCLEFVETIFKGDRRRRRSLENRDVRASCSVLEFEVRYKLGEYLEAIKGWGAGQQVIFYCMI